MIARRIAIALALAATAACGARGARPARPALESTGGREAVTRAWPLAIGTRWTYRAHLHWTEEINGGAAFQEVERSIDWTCEIVDAYARDGVTVAQVRGTLGELVDYTDGARPGLHTLVRARGRYYLLDGDAFARLRTAAFTPEPAREVMIDALAVGASFGALDPDRPDGRYRWNVEATRAIDLREVTGAPASTARGFEATMQTNPDDQGLVVVPGLGIVAYEYHHHGTARDVGARLIHVEPGR